MRTFLQLFANARRTFVGSGASEVLKLVKKAFPLDRAMMMRSSLAKPSAVFDVLVAPSDHTAVGIVRLAVQGIAQAAPCSVKGARSGDTMRTVRSVASGDAIFDPGIAERVLRYLPPPAPAPSRRRSPRSSTASARSWTHRPR